MTGWESWLIRLFGPVLPWGATPTPYIRTAAP